MRDLHYLRTPLKSHDFSSLTIQEVPFSNDFGQPDPCPQAIEITFTPLGQPNVEIALVWDGQLRFLPDSTTLPNSPADVTEANFPNWNLTGTLVLSLNDSSSAAKITRDVPLLKNWPTTARYEKVTLTRPFLFTTLRRQQNLKFKHAAATVDQSDPRWFEKFIVEFVHGRVSCLANVDAADPANDFTEQSMPIVAAPRVGSTFKLLFSCASRDIVTLFPDWFAPQPYDDPEVPDMGAVLVPLSLRSAIDLDYNTRHPGHSIIPPRLIFASAPDDAWAPDHLAHPIRDWTRTSLPAGHSYRRVELLRSLRPDPPPSLDRTRPYPLHQLAWQRDGAPDTEAFRIPLDGYIYAPLADAIYDFWTIPRAANASSTTTGDEFRLAVQVSPAMVDLPAQRLQHEILPGDDAIVLYADVQPHDALRAWTRLKDLGGRVNTLQDQANARWGIWDRKSLDDWHHPNNYFINRSDTFADWAPIYGYILAAANRHGLAPELVHAVFMGEGGITAITTLQNRGEPFSPNAFMNTFKFLGLDLIIYRLGLNTAAPPKTTAEFSENLVTEGYVDPSFAANVTRTGTQTRDEGVETLVLEVGRVDGWETAIELVAAEIHFRMDQMVRFCAANGIAITTEEQRRFLAYIRYLSEEPRAQAHARRIDSDMRKWSAADDPKPATPVPSTIFDAKYRRYETLRRLAVAQWYEAAEVYR
ncbi:MAG TPA: hypothetical protein VJS17_05810 [Pyrinomonadaceae bacterium]|nr:hypothetical protein [Pyrinomonadaceae bacterium]